MVLVNVLDTITLHLRVSGRIQVLIVEIYFCRGLRRLLARE